MDKNEVDLVNLHVGQVRPPERIEVPLPHGAGGPWDAQAGCRGPDSRVGRSGGPRQADRAAVGDRTQLRPPLSRRGQGRLPRSSGRAAARRGHATRSRTALRRRSPKGTPSSSSRNSPPRGSRSSSAPCSGPSRRSRQEARARALATVRFETTPGQQMQIDFGQKVVAIAGEAVTVHLMTVVLGYSRRLFCRAFLAERQDDWLEGIDAACRHFGGLTEQILCDNASPLVTSHDPKTGAVVWHPGFAAFCKDRGITPRLPPATRPDQGEDRTRRRLRQAQRPGRAVVRRVRGPADGTWRSGSSRSPTDAFTARRTNNRSSVSSATNARRCGPCRLGRWRSGRDACLDA